MEAQYGTDADEAWIVGRVMAVNAEGTCDVHYEDGDKEAGKPCGQECAPLRSMRSPRRRESWSWRGERRMKRMESWRRAYWGGQRTVEMEAIAALAWCGEGSVGVHAAAAIEDGEEDGDEVAFAFGGKGGCSLSSSSTGTKKKQRKRKKRVFVKERSGEVPVSASDASAMKIPGR